MKTTKQNSHRTTVTESAIAIYFQVRFKHFEKTPTTLSVEELRKEVLSQCMHLPAIEAGVVLSLVSMDYEKLFGSVVQGNVEKRADAKRELVGQKGAGPLISRFFDQNSDIGKFGRA